MEGIIIPENKIAEVESYSTSASLIEVMYDIDNRPYIDVALRQYLINQGCTWISSINPELITLKPNPFNR